MYSDKKSVRQLTALLKAHGVTKVVVCPGSQVAPLIQTCLQVTSFTCYPVNDHRSAGFFAIGLALHEAAPVAVVCTAGNGLSNMLPAVAEAYQQQVPLVVISADTVPARLQEPLVFGNVVKKAVNLPEVQSEEDALACNRLINEALLESRHHGKGPVHINIQLSDPAFGCNTTELEEERVMVRYQGLNMYEQDYQPLVERLNRLKKRMVVAGQMNNIYEFDKKNEATLSKQFVWFTESLSNHTTPGRPIRRMEELLYPMDLKTLDNLTPELLITFGGAVVSRRLKYFLRKHKPLEHWHVSKDGEVYDTFGALTAIIEMDPFEFFEKIPYSELQAVGLLMEALPKGCSLHLGNSSVVRMAQLFGMPEEVEMQSNMGLEGAEGALATALGYATASEKINFIVLGDLSFFCGMSALWNSNYGSNIRLMVINNGGNAQQQTLPGFTPDDRALRMITGAHQASAKAWAEDRGFTYLSAHNEEELQAALPAFVKPDITRQPLFLEVFTDKASDAEVLKQYYKSLKKG